MKTLLHITTEVTSRLPDVEVAGALLACLASAITGAQVTSTQTPGSPEP